VTTTAERPSPFRSAVDDQTHYSPWEEEMNLKARTRLGSGLVSATLAAVTVPVVMVGVAGSASAAASCGQPGPLIDFTVVNMTPGVSANMRSGSSTGCGATGWADNQDTLMYYCFTRNASGSTWTYVWNLDDNTLGWVSDSLLPGNDSNYHCGF
jgi:hypothetical protein